MPTPTSFRPARKVTAGRATRMAGTANDWRCSSCGKLLGVRRDGVMHLSFARGHEYLVSKRSLETAVGLA